MTSTTAAVRPTGWRESRWLLAAELAIVAALTLGHRRVPLSATPFFVALGWISLLARGLGWRDVGLVRPRPLGRTLALGLSAGLILELLSTFVTEPTLAAVFGQPPDLSDFRPLVGNVQLLGLAVTANWILAAFGEEMAFRGYLMNRLAGLAGGTRRGWVFALIAATAVFGACHYESQGLTGAVQAGVDGLLLALLYLAGRRTLAVPILAHGMSNTLAFVLIYFGRYPGL